MSGRLPPVDGEWIDRQHSYAFEFEGERIDAFAGDVISSALLASGRRTLARSFKYHRPRGVLSFANHDANVLVETASATNVRADVTRPVADERYRAVNTAGGVSNDALRALGLFSPVLPVGFYYKAFYRPRCSFRWWERLIRRLAGLGRVPSVSPRDRLPRRHAWCDVLVIGAGAAGLAAAQTLAARGIETIVVDENPHAGGSLNHRDRGLDGAQPFLQTARSALAQSDCVSVVTGHVASAFYADHCVPLLGADGIVLVHARSVIVATGVYDQPAVFRDNDRPGVMLASAAARLAHCYAVRPFEQGVVVAGHADAYRQAMALRDAGLTIDTIIDIAGGGERDALIEHARGAGIDVVMATALNGTRARAGELAAVTVSAGGTTRTIDCDGLLMDVGRAPAAGLLVQAGGRLRYDERSGQHLPHDLPVGVFAAGSVNGVFALDARIADGRAAAGEALAAIGADDAAPERPARDDASPSHPYPIFPAPKAFVDFDEDLATVDLVTAVREGFDSVELMKRYSTIGMGPSQGKVSNVNGIRILAHARGEPVNDIGITTPRPFIQPVPLNALAGRRLRHVARTPLDAWHRAAGAHMKESGAWLRPTHYGNGDSADRIAEEYRAVRERVGLIDVSTLGKIELFGPDAEALLTYAYPCSFARLTDGAMRYVFMLDGGGTIIDDGVCGRLAEDHFYITTSTAQSARAIRQFELYAAQLALDVIVLDRTQAWGALNLAGPDSRSVLAPLTDIELDGDAFPYQALRDGCVAGVPARVMRVGFVGELGYEIHVEASALLHVWESLFAAGEAYDISAFGVDAQRLLRLEKGHCIVGQDTDGTTHPGEIGLARAVRRDDRRFVGRRALGALRARVERSLVGFSAPSNVAAQLAECLLVIEGNAIVGRITSVARSPKLDCTIGLALVSTHLAAPGTPLQIRLASGDHVTVEVVTLPFYDGDNARQSPPASPAGVIALPVAGFDQSHQSPVMALAANHDMETGVRNGMTIAIRQTRAHARPAYLADISAIRRRLVVGRDAGRFLQASGVPAPQALQTCAPFETDGVVVRRHIQEFMVIEGLVPQGSRVFDTVGRDGDTLVTSPQLAEFALGGSQRETILHEFCAIRLPLAEAFWRQLRFAHCNAVLWQPAGDCTQTRILCDPASAVYLFAVLRDALGVDGEVIGYDDYMAMHTAER